MSSLKERFVRSASAAIILGSTLGGACNRPTISNETPSIQATHEAWNALPPLERLRRLEQRNLPRISDFHPSNEISLATAQFYCEQTKCNTSSKEMAASVFYLDENAFFKRLETDREKKYSSEELAKEKEKQIAFTSENRDAVYINQTLLGKVIREIRKSQPEIPNRLGNKDLDTLLKKSLLMHEFFHENLPSQAVTFSPFSISLFNRDQPINFDRLNEFEISGKSQDGKRIFYIVGGNEAVVELAGQIISEKSGSYLGLVKEYTSGASLVRQLNTQAGITNNEFLKYLNGELLPEELVKKWTKGDLKNGVMILAAIGLHVQGFTSAKETQGFIDDILRNS